VASRWSSHEAVTRELQRNQATSAERGVAMQSRPTWKSYIAAAAHTHTLARDAHTPTKHTRTVWRSHVGTYAELVTALCSYSIPSLHHHRWRVAHEVTSKTCAEHACTSRSNWKRPRRCVDVRIHLLVHSTGSDKTLGLPTRSKQPLGACSRRPPGLMLS
jgi:hypothetical protein